MSEAAALLALVQRLSPAFPVGGYAYSHGLETAMAAGEITSAATLEPWLAALIGRGSGWTDAILLCQAMRPGADIPALADLARALAASRERWVESLDQGRAYGEVLARLPALAEGSAAGSTGPATGAATEMGAGRAVAKRAETGAPEPLPYAVAVGRSCAGLGLPAETVAALWLQGFAGNLVQAAVRFVPLGQGEGQAVLARLHPLLLRTAAEAAQAGLDDLASATFRADLAAMAHETLDVRIFRT